MFSGHFVLLNPISALFEPAGGKVVGKTIYIGFYENETEWNKEQVDRVQVRIMSSRSSVVVRLERLIYTNSWFVKPLTMQ